MSQSRSQSPAGSCPGNTNAVASCATRGRKITRDQSQYRKVMMASMAETRQATTSVKRCCTSRQRHQEVWSGPITTDAPGVTLAGHSRASKLQAGSAAPPVSARQGASVPIKLLHSSQSSSFAAASTLRCTSSTDRTSTSSQHLRSAGICCRWSDDV